MAKKRATNGSGKDMRPRLRPKADAPAKKPGARSQVLPGMDQVRDRRLDNLCESMAEHRRAMNQARVEEQTDIAAALQHMVKKGVSVYRHGGIELARVPGAERLRVRLTKEQGDADADDLETGDDDAGIGGGEFGKERREAVEAED
jgi:hypothetical protein